jgi:hypothetical protein
LLVAAYCTCQVNKHPEPLSNLKERSAGFPLRPMQSPKFVEKLCICLKISLLESMARTIHVMRTGILGLAQQGI